MAKVAMEELQRLASLPGASTDEIILNGEEELVQKYWQWKASLPSDGVLATPVAPADRSYRSNNLPRLELPTFAGDPLESISFWDRFTNLMKKDSTLEDGDIICDRIWEKVHYRAYYQNRVIGTTG